MDSEDKGCALILGMIFVTIGLGFLWCWGGALIALGILLIILGVISDATA